MNVSIKRHLRVLTRSLSGLKNVDAILCFGSYAQETADRYSDIDLLVLCKPQIPSTQLRQRCFSRLSKVNEVEINRVSSWDGAWNPVQDRLQYENKWIDITYNQTVWMTKVINRAVRAGATSTKEMPFRPYTLCGLIKNSLILEDKNHAAHELKKLIEPYPPQLRDNLFEVHMPRLRDCLADLGDYVKRDIGNSAFLFQLQLFLDSLVTLLFAINQRYDPASKRRELDIGKLPLLPTNFLERYEKILAGSFVFRRRVGILKELVDFTKFIESYK